jgi:hypothetical protein
MNLEFINKSPQAIAIDRAMAISVKRTRSSKCGGRAIFLNKHFSDCTQNVTKCAMCKTRKREILTISLCVSLSLLLNTVAPILKEQIIWKH